MRAILLPFLVACGGAQVASGDSSRGRSAGGALKLSDMPPQAVRVVNGALEVWGQTEVPAASRLQAALSMVDSVTRAELVKFVTVSVQSMDEERQSDAGSFVSVKVTEAAAATVPPGSPVQRGWEIRGDMLHIVGRLTVERSVFAAALADTMPEVSEEQRGVILERLFGTR